MDIGFDIMSDINIVSVNEVQRKADEVVEANGMVSSTFNYANMYEKIKQEV